MDGFVELFRDMAISAGISPSDVFSKRSIDLPGYYRPTKKWDLIIVSENRLLAVIEVKSQVGPSFGTTSTIELKKRWVARMICGLLTGKANLEIRFNPGLAISLC